MASDNEKLIRDFMDRMSVSYDEQCQAYRDMFAEGCVWSNMGFPDCVGPEQAVGLLEMMRAKGIETVKIDIENIVSDGDLIFAQRVDHLVRGDGTVAGFFPVTGVIRMKAGKIVRWQEYFDPRGPLEILGRGRGGL